MVKTADNRRIDLSFIPSYYCNLECNFCMYSCSPKNNIFMDLNKTRKFIDSIDWDWTNSIGFYGGELSLFMGVWKQILDYLPSEVDKWCITNGSWSRNSQVTMAFMSFLQLYDIRCYVSSTFAHKKHQNSIAIDIFCSDGNLKIKEDDTQGHLLPMGRNKKNAWDCTKKCERTHIAARYALTPTGNVIFQSCDGIYPVIGVDYPDFEIIKEHYLVLRKIWEE